MINGFTPKSRYITWSQHLRCCSGGGAHDVGNRRNTGFVTSTSFACSFHELYQRIFIQLPATFQTETRGPVSLNFDRTTRDTSFKRRAVLLSENAKSKWCVGNGAAGARSQFSRLISREEFCDGADYDISEIGIEIRVRDEDGRVFNARTVNSVPVYHYRDCNWFRKPIDTYISSKLLTVVQNDLDGAIKNLDQNFGEVSFWLGNTDDIGRNGRHVTVESVRLVVYDGTRSLFDQDTIN